MEAGHQLEVRAVVQAETVIAGTPLVTIKVVRCSPIPNIFLWIIELRFVKCSGFPFTALCSVRIHNSSDG
mgnify:CR=1 FL=1